MALVENNRAKKTGTNETFCKDCADKRNRRQGSKSINYCRFTGQCLREAIKSCPYGG